MRIVVGLEEKYTDKIVNWSAQFKGLYDKSYFSFLVYFADSDISCMLLNDQDEIVGVYLLDSCEESNSFFGKEKYNGLIGAEGMLLFIEEEYRGKGWGNKLKDMPKELGFDFVWGRQSKRLNNLHHWLKRRELILEDVNEYITAQIF